VEQTNFQKRVEALGFKYFIVRDLEEIKNIINNELNL
jgi:hypothetical protein